MMPHPCASSHLQHIVGICSLKDQVLHAPLAEDDVLPACWTYVCTFVVPCDKGSMVHTVSQDVCTHFSALYDHLMYPTKTFLKYSIFTVCHIRYHRVSRSNVGIAQTQYMTIHSNLSKSQER